LVRENGRKWNETNESKKKVNRLHREAMRRKDANDEQKNWVMR
jgi:hypothetical protein